eukprot:CAMPEP_0117019756 /NCGR_PEP_ID=MMETSP0472-20121206/15109_1 /TAXON_ID=693140 ORGANISM="Tiarina fusus, Strain LIS" /NCGR_SAMPLE_ID=MMETSP0472 /ASSEMBLY_ACC=CAM_ASM_000603 /LENGTH=90 /DNA_ID=CAMNT_0004724789 /DNA_START=269 /DNA_END=541 /DNA_ORIENTATION=-
MEVEVAEVQATTSILEEMEDLEAVALDFLLTKQMIYLKTFSKRQVSMTIMILDSFLETNVKEEVVSKDLVDSVDLIWIWEWEWEWEEVVV